MRAVLLWIIVLSCLKFNESLQLRFRHGTFGMLRTRLSPPKMSTMRPFEKRAPASFLSDSKSEMTRGEFIELVSSVLNQSNSINKHLRNGVSVLQKGSGTTTTQDKKLDGKQWNELLASAIAYNLGDISLQVFSKMNELKVPPASHVSVKLVSHLAERHRTEDAQQVLATLATQSAPLTVHHYLALLRCSGSFGVAQKVLFQMECARFDINVMTYSTAIKSCESTSDVMAALQLLDQMKAMGIPPNEITYCCAISVASKALRGDLAVNLLYEMQQAQRPADHASGVNQLCYGSALTACARCDMWEQVDALLQEIVDDGAQIQETVFVGIISPLRRNATGHAVSAGENIIQPWQRLEKLLEKWTAFMNCTTDRVQTSAAEVYEAFGQHNRVIKLYQQNRERLQGRSRSRSLLQCVLRACINQADAECALQAVRDAEKLGYMTGPMYLSALSILEMRGLHKEALSLVAAMPISSPSEGDLLPALVPLRTIRRVLCNALRDMTQVFMQTYSAVKTSTSCDRATTTEHFAYTETVATRVAKLVAAGSVLDEDCYPLACKLLLDTGDYAALRVVLNQTQALSATRVDSARLYDFAARHLATVQPLRVGLSALLLLAGDLCDGGKFAAAAEVCMRGIECVQALVVSLRPEVRSGASRAVASPGADAGISAEAATKLLASREVSQEVRSALLSSEDRSGVSAETDDMRGTAQLLTKFITSARKLLGSSHFPVGAYQTAVEVYRLCRQPEQIVETHSAAAKEYRNAPAPLNLTAAVLSALSDFPTYHRTLFEIYTKARPEIATSDPVVNETVWSIHMSALRACEATGERSSAMEIARTLRCGLGTAQTAAADSSTTASHFGIPAQALPSSTASAALERELIRLHGQWKDWTSAAAALERLKDITLPSGTNNSTPTCNGASVKVKSPTINTGDTLVHALSVHGEEALAERVYWRALQMDIFHPFANIHRGIVDVQYHSPNTARVAVRLALYMLATLFGANAQDLRVNSADSELVKKVRQFASTVAAARTGKKGDTTGAGELVVVLGNIDKAREIREYLENELGTVCSPRAVPSNRVVIPAESLMQWALQFFT